MLLVACVGLVDTTRRHLVRLDLLCLCMFFINEVMMTILLQPSSSLHSSSVYFWMSYNLSLSLHDWPMENSSAFIRIHSHSSGAEDYRTLEYISNLADLFFDKEEYALAEPLYGQCINVIKRKYAPPDVAPPAALNSIITALANLYTCQVKRFMIYFIYRIFICCLLSFVFCLIHLG